MSFAGIRGALVCGVVGGGALGSYRFNLIELALDKSFGIEQN